VLNSLILWHHKYFCGVHDFAILDFFPLSCVKHVSSCSDDEEPQRNTVATPSAQAVTVDEPSAQEVEPAVQAPRTTRASVKKVPVT
jgi:hypothetical protein